jgi:hypothetical protein
MTKLREPVTIENTLYTVLGSITIERAAEVTGRAVSYLRSLTDPDKRERLTIEDAIALDLEYRAQGKQGYPLLGTYIRIIEAAQHDKFAEEHAFGQLACDYVRESGQASAALVAAMLPGASLHVLETALRELEDADSAAAPTITHLQTRIKRAREGPAVHPPDG